MALTQPTSALATTTMPVSYTEPWRPYVELALAAMGYSLEQSGSLFQVVANAEEGPPAVGPKGGNVQNSGDGVSSKSGRWRSVKHRLRRGKDDAAPAVDLQSDSPAAILDWVLQQGAAQQQLASYVPTSDPHAVHEIVASMFAAYTIDGGTVHLGGCHLQDTPILRITRAGHADASTGAAAESVTHAYFDCQGQPLADEVVRQLHLTEVALPEEPKPAQSTEQWSPAIAAAESLLGGDLHEPERVASVVLAKWAQGQLQVTIGDESLAINFAGWTRTLSAPPAICPQSGRETYHLTTLGDGRIAAAEQVVTCEESGERILRSSSVRCCVTGKQVDKACCEPCPVSGELALPEGFAECDCCHGRVSRVQLTKTGCCGCDGRAEVGRDEPRLAAIISATPKLGRFKKWRLAHTDALWIAETGGLFSRYLVVIAKQSGQVCHAARRGRLARAWRPLSEDERRELLG